MRRTHSINHESTGISSPLPRVVKICSSQCSRRSRAPLQPWLRCSVSITSRINTTVWYGSVRQRADTKPAQCVIGKVLNRFVPVSCSPRRIVHTQENVHPPEDFFTSWDQICRGTFIHKLLHIGNQCLVPLSRKYPILVEYIGCFLPGDTHTPVGGVVYLDVDTTNCMDRLWIPDPRYSTMALFCEAADFLTLESRSFTLELIYREYSEENWGDRLGDSTQSG